MRPYATISPLFWTGSTGKKLRLNPDAQRVALYLMTSPHSHQTGIYYLPMMYLCNEVGISTKGASKALAWCSDEGFAQYDLKCEWVWVCEMASWQIGSDLSEQDKRCKGVQQYLSTVPNLPFVSDFVTRYAADFHLSQVKIRPLQGATEGASSEHIGSGTGSGTDLEQDDSVDSDTRKTSEPKKRASRRCPTDFEVTSDLRKWAEEKFPGVDLDRETGKFRDHEYKDPKSDWPAAWRTWITKSVEFRGVTPIVAQKRASAFPS